MKILVIGGTQFVGYHIVEAALERGHDVTIFHRGVDCTAHPRAKHIHGDRNQDAQLLETEKWDAVIDSCGYFPRQVALTAQAVKPNVSGVFCFISTISVYQPGSEPSMDEDHRKAEFKEGTDPSTEVVDGETYGPLKVACEKAILDCFGDRALIVRPGLVVGPRDHTQRLKYWLHRMNDGGRVLAPGAPERPVQMIDGRDLGKFVVHGVENSLTGSYNATGPKDVLSMKDLLDTMQAAIGKDGTELVWVDDNSLIAQGCEEFVSLPMWLVEKDNGMFTANIQKALSAGLTLRPLRDTVVDAFKWESTEANHAAPAKHGITRERESEILTNVGKA